MMTKRLPCALTDDQLRERGEELASLHQELDLISAEKKESNSNFKARSEAVQIRANELAGEISSKTEYRDVIVTEEKNYEKKEAYVIRTDTRQVVSTRALHPEELQRPIPFEHRDFESSDSEVKTTMTFPDGSEIDLAQATNKVREKLNKKATSAAS